MAEPNILWPVHRCICPALFPPPSDSRLKKWLQCEVKRAISFLVPGYAVLAGARGGVSIVTQVSLATPNTLAPSIYNIDLPGNDAARGQWRLWFLEARHWNKYSCLELSGFVGLWVGFGFSKPDVGTSMPAACLGLNGGRGVSLWVGFQWALTFECSWLHATVQSAFTMTYGPSKFIGGVVTDMVSPKYVPNNAPHCIAHTAAH
jgi:hypothetical protein